MGNIKPVFNLEDYDNTKTIRLVRLYYRDTSPVGFRSGVHISCNYPGYAVISTYTANGVQEQNWLDRTATLARLDRVKPRLFFLAKIYNTTGQYGDSRDYWEETHASISRDGSPGGLVRKLGTIWTGSRPAPGLSDAA
ncbi:MAG: hypothetical protein NTY36_00495 [Deltaproteobacteria bacterium]|nr:hypothetical protein [Deltaproteobacteria bacterium]